jgi:hypothetical protein
VRRHRLTAEVARASEYLEDHLGPAPFGRPGAEVVDALGFDAVARPGTLFFDSDWLGRASSDYLCLTVAHEVAHQWWGLLVADEPFLREPAAEFWAWRAIGDRSADAERHQLRLARGRLARYAAGESGPQSEEDRRLGRDALALHAWWRSRPASADAWMRERVIAATRGAKPALPDELERWASSKGVPSPAVHGGVVTDAANTGLETLVAIEAETSRRTDERWLTGRIVLSPGERLSDEQMGPVLAGDMASAIRLVTALPDLRGDV